MRYIYIIKSKKFGNIYIGYTHNIVKRLNEHNLGKSEYTRKFLPWKVVYLEGYASEEEAKNREQKLKQFGRVYSQLKRRVRHSLES